MTTASGFVYLISNVVYAIWVKHFYAICLFSSSNIVKCKEDYNSFEPRYPFQTLFFA